MKFTASLALASLLGSATMATTTAASASTTTTNIDNDDNDTTTCRLWLAPSNLASPALLKFGLYAGVSLEADQVLPFGSNEVALPFVDFFIEGTKQTPYRRGIVEWLESQFWLADYVGSKYEGNVSATAFVPGVGALAAYHSAVYNVELWQHAAWTNNDNNNKDATSSSSLPVPGMAHASRGAISPFAPILARTTRVIPAGMELFANYGDVWDAAKDTSLYQDKIVRQDYQDADKIVTRCCEYFDKFPHMSDALKDETLNFMLRAVVNQAGGFRAKALQSLIPNNWRLLKQVQEVGGTFNYRFPDMIKTPQWLQRNGLCVDNLQVKPSTIPGAGRGAFARRAVQQDDVISPIPTTIIGDASLLDMFDVLPGGGQDPMGRTVPPGNYFNYSAPRGQQLALNYCYGHPESSMLLLPLAPMVNYVNHAGGQGEGGGGDKNDKKPNAVLRWAEHEKVMNDYATQDNLIADVANHRSHLITLELVALRDIAVGEEILMDYGPEWEDAWADYTSRASMAQPGATWPLKAIDLRQVFATKAFPVKVTDETNPYPAGVVTACFMTLDQMPDGVPHFTDAGEDRYIWNGNVDDLKGADLTYCDLLDKMETPEGSWNYTVRTRLQEENFIEVIHVPHGAVTVVDLPYTSDVHHAEAFRYPIAVPDEIWPQHWRDLR